MKKFGLAVLPLLVAMSVNAADSQPLLAIEKGVLETYNGVQNKCEIYATDKPLSKAAVDKLSKKAKAYLEALPLFPLPSSQVTRYKLSKQKVEEGLKRAAGQAMEVDAIFSRAEVPSEERVGYAEMKVAVGPAATALVRTRVQLTEVYSRATSRAGFDAEGLRSLIEVLCDQEDPFL